LRLLVAHREDPPLPPQLAVTLDVALHGLFELAHGERLDEVALRAALDGEAGGLELRSPGHEDDGDVLVVPAHPAQELDAAGIGQVDVAQDHVEVALAHQPQRGLDRGAGHRFQPPAFEHPDAGLEEDVIVVDDEHRGTGCRRGLNHVGGSGHRCRPGAHGPRGSEPSPVSSGDPSAGARQRLREDCHGPPASV